MEMTSVARGINMWKSEVRKHFPMCLENRSYPTLEVQRCDNSNTLQVGDQIMLREVKCVAAQVGRIPNETDSDIEYIKVQASHPEHFKVCLRNPFDHTYTSIREIIDAYPAVSEGIFATELFTVDGVQIMEYEMLRIVTKVEANFPENEKLGVAIKRGKRIKYLFLPQDLQINFRQARLDSEEFYSSALFGSTVRDGYTVCELAEMWKTANDPLLIQIKAALPKEKKKHSKHSTASVKQILRKIYTGKNSKKAAVKVDKEVKNKLSSWFQDQLVFEPILEARVSLKSDPENIFTLPENLQLEVSECTDDNYSDSDTENSISLSTPSMSTSNSSSVRDKVSNSCQTLKSCPLETVERDSLSELAIVVMVYENNSKRCTFKEDDWIAFHRKRKESKLVLIGADHRLILITRKFTGRFVRVMDKEDDVGDGKNEEMRASEIFYLDLPVKVRLVNQGFHVDNHRFEAEEEFQVVTIIEETTVICEKLHEDNGEFFGCGEFKELSVDRDALSLENFSEDVVDGVISGFKPYKRSFVFPQLTFLPRVEEINKTDLECLLDTSTYCSTNLTGPVRSAPRLEELTHIPVQPSCANLLSLDEVELKMTTFI